MNSIDQLEHGGAQPGWPFSIRLHGQTIALADPTTLHYQMVLAALYVEHVPGTPPMADWKRDAVFERWRAAWGLPPFNDARRLAYLVDNYRGALTSDLHTFANGLDLGELWRARRWEMLLDVIDRLPPHSWYASTVAQDEDHSKMLAESVAARQAQGEPAEDRGPSLTGWTPEVAALTTLIDATRGVQHAVYAAQHGKKAGDPPKPMPRPVTALEKALKAASFNARKAKHEALVARVLRRKPPVKAESSH